MLEEVALVKKVEGDDVWLETSVKTTCSSCHVQQGCGTSVIAKAFSAKTELLKLRTPIALVPGQQVKIGIPEEFILKASFMMYGIPLLVLILSAAVMTHFAPNLPEWGLILISFAFTYLSFKYLARYAQSHERGEFAPVILGAVNPGVQTVKNQIPIQKDNHT